MTFLAKASGKRGEIYVYEAIGEGWFGGITAKSFADSLRELGNVAALDIYINSPGGSVFDGVAIHNLIKRHAAAEKIVHVDGIAASIASIIAMAGTEIRIAANGMLMIHDPWGMSIGTAADMRRQADALDKVRSTLLDTYVARTGREANQVSDWMTAETWMTADEAVDRGFADKKTDEKAVKAEFAMLEKFARVPDQLRRQAASLDARFARMNMRLTRLNTQSRGASPAKA